KLLQGKMNQQLQLKNGELPPVGILVKFYADQRGNIGMVVQLIFVQTFKQCRQARIVQAMQVQDILTEQQRLIGVVPDQIIYGVDFRIVRYQNTACHGTQLVIHSHVYLFTHPFQQAEQG